MRGVELIPIAAFSDNYLWLLHNGTHAAVVDPGDAAPVMRTLAQLELALCAILVTHHHADHVSGLPRLLQQHAVPVYGPAHEAIAGVTHPLAQGSEVVISELDLQLQVLDVPGHTAGHIAYFATSAPGRSAPILLCGDTLFSAGCGRLFEGTAAQMVQSLAQLAALPDTTEVYCTHEYTLSNLAFASAAEPVNPARDVYREWCVQQRELGLPTLPSTLAREKAVNPFLRCDVPEVRQAVARQCGTELHTTRDVFAALREWKNHFRA